MNIMKQEGESAGSPASRKKVTAALFFILTTMAALVIQDLYDTAKNTVDPILFTMSIKPDDECPDGEWLFPENLTSGHCRDSTSSTRTEPYKHGGYSTEKIKLN